MSHNPPDPRFVNDRFGLASPLILNGKKMWNKGLERALAFSPKDDTRCAWQPNGGQWLVDVAFSTECHARIKLLFQNIHKMSLNQEDFITSDNDYRPRTEELKSLFVDTHLPQYRKGADKLFHTHHQDMEYIGNILRKALRYQAPGSHLFEADEHTVGQPAYLCFLSILKLFTEPFEARGDKLGVDGYFRYWVFRTALCYAADGMTAEEQETMQPLISKLKLACSPTLLIDDDRMLTDLYHRWPESERTLVFYEQLTRPFPDKDKMVKELDARLQDEIRGPYNEGKPKIFSSGQILGHIVYQFDLEVSRFVRRHVKMVRIVSELPHMTRPIIDRKFVDGDVYLFSEAKANPQDEFPIYSERTEEEGVFYVDLKGSTELLRRYGSGSLARFMETEFTIPLYETIGEYQRPFSPTDYLKWAEVINDIGDAFLLRGDIDSIIHIAIRFRATVERYAHKVRDNYTWLFEREKNPERIRERLTLLQGGIAVAYTRQGNSIYRPDGQRTYIGQGAFMASRLGDRNKEIIKVTKEVAHEFCGRTDKDPELPLAFNVFVAGGKIYNNGLALTERSVLEFLKGCRCVQGPRGPVPLPLKVTYSRLNREIKEKFSFPTEDLGLYITEHRTTGEVFYLRFVGAYENEREFDDKINVFELMPLPKGQETSFTWLLHKHHGIRALQENEHRLV